MQSGKSTEGEENRTRARICADLDGGVDSVANDAGVRLPGAEPHGGDLGAGVEHEVPRHRRQHRKWGNVEGGRCTGSGGGLASGGCEEEVAPAYIGAGGPGRRGRLGAAGTSWPRSFERLRPDWPTRGWCGCASARAPSGLSGFRPTPAIARLRTCITHAPYVSPIAIRGPSSSNERVSISFCFILPVSLPRPP